MWPTKRQMKKYVIENCDRIQKDGSRYALAFTGPYFEEITINYVNANGYNLIAWGNRKSKLGWFIWGDFQVRPDILYKEYKKKSTYLDKELLRILKEIE